jgi:hypothetical protein
LAARGRQLASEAALKFEHDVANATPSAIVEFCASKRGDVRFRQFLYNFIQTISD